MTTTQTGGGNGAAPDGGSGRKLPTRPGHWLIVADPLHSPDEIEHEVVRIRQGSGGLLIVGKSPARVDQRPDIVWLAPIPGPAVLAALAEYVELLAFVDASGKVTGPLDAAGLDAGLRAAIRAERDGAS